MSLVAFLTGIALLAVGLRARRVAKRRVAEKAGRCIACGYFVDDLRPLADRCPECGATIRSRAEAASIIGSRADSMVSGASALTVIGAIICMTTAIGAWGSAVRVAWMLAPTDWLIAEVAGATDMRDNAYIRAANELQRRWTSGRLTQEDGHALGSEMAALFSRATGYSSDDLRMPAATAISGRSLDPVSISMREGAVARFSDPATTPSWWLDEMMAQALSSGVISESERQSIVATALPAIIAGRQTTHLLSSAIGDEIAEGRVSLAAFIEALHREFRPAVVLPYGGSVRPEETFAIGVDLGVRAGRIPAPFAVQLQLAGDAADWEKWQSLPGPPEAMWQASSSTWASTRAPDIPQISTMVRAPSAPGAYDITARVTIWFTRLTEADHHEFDTLDESEAPLGAFSFVASARLRVGGEPFPPPRLVETPFERDDFGDCDRCGNYAWRSPGSDAVGVKILLDTAPADVAAEVLLEQHGVEHPIGWVFLPAGRSAGVVSGRAPGVEHGPVRIVLRPATAPLRTYDPQRLLYEKDLVIPTKVWGQPGDATP